MKDFVRRMLNNILLTILVLFFFYAWLIVGCLAVEGLKMTGVISIFFIQAWGISFFILADSRVQKFKAF